MSFRNLACCPLFLIDHISGYKIALKIFTQWSSCIKTVFIAHYFNNESISLVISCSSGVYTCAIKSECFLWYHFNKGELISFEY